MIRQIDNPVYYAHTVFDVKSLILEGWCAWEWAFKTGKSPELAKFISAQEGFVDSHLKCRQPDAVLPDYFGLPKMFGGNMTQVLPEKPPAPSISSAELFKLRSEFGW